MRQRFVRPSAILVAVGGVVGFLGLLVPIARQSISIGAVTQVSTTIGAWSLSTDGAQTDTVSTPEFGVPILVTTTLCVLAAILLHVRGSTSSWPAGFVCAAGAGQTVAVTTAEMHAAELLRSGHESSVLSGAWLLGVAGCLCLLSVVLVTVGLGD
jgi:hypothetical protein